jgi:glycine/D-amino acid oxidase-like deaminating enzyme
VTTAQRRREFIVIGGGLVGSALAYGLACLGRQVTMLDEGDVAWRAARGNFGLVWVQGKGLGMPEYAGWTRASARRWPELAARLAADTGIDVALLQPGGYHLCLSDAELAHRVAALTRLAAQPGFGGAAFDVLDRAALAARLPGIGPDVAGATFGGEDGHVNPLRLLRALHAGFLRYDGEYRAGHAVTRIERAGSAFAVTAGGQRYEAERIVLAAGLGNAALAPQVGLEAPVRPQRGMVIALERVRRFLVYPTSTLRQTDDGTVLIGDSQEEVGADDSLDAAVLAAMAERAVRAFPLLRDVRVNRSWAALRVMTPDAFPLYDQAREAPGAFVATCHSGVTLAAAHVLDLAPRIAAGDLGSDLAPYAAQRLHVPQAA